MKIGTKLLLALASISIFPPIGAYLVLVSNPRVSFALHMNDYEAEQYRLAGQLRSDVHAMVSAFEESLNETYRIRLNLQQKADAERQRAHANAAFEAAISTYESDLAALTKSQVLQERAILKASHIDGTGSGFESELEEAQSLKVLRDALPKLKSNSKKFIVLSDAFSEQEEKFVYEVLDPESRETLSQVQRLENASEQESAEDRRNIEMATTRSYKESMLVALSGPSVGIFLAVLLSRLITAPIVELRNSAKEIGLGKLGCRVRVHSRDEIGELSGSFNRMADNLEKLVAEVRFKNTLFEVQNETTIDGILAVDEANQIILSNRQFSSMWGVSEEMIRAKDDAPVLQQVLERVKKPEQFLDKVKYLYSHRGERSKDEVQLRDGRSFERYSSPLFDPKGKYYGRIWYFRDITERLKTEEQLQLWSRVLDQSAEGIFVCDPQERILLINKSFEKLTGFSSMEAIGRTPRILHSGLQDRAFYSKMWDSLLSTGIWQGEMWNRRKDGEKFAEWLSITAVYDNAGCVTHYVGVFSDITARKRDLDRMVRLAQFDALTDLPNRTLFLDRLNQMIAGAERSKSKLGVIFVDVDRFKEVNDSLGHDAGDQLLQTLAKRLSNSIRKQDTVARIGGDEFVVAIQNLDDAANTAIIAQKLLSRLAEPVIVKSFELAVTASLGIAVYPDDGIDGPELIRNADAAMYQAKNAGRNAFHFYTNDLNRRALEMLSTENALRRAIEREQFVLHYQPQVNIKNGALVGAEALIRWNHPEMGLVMPGKFIPVAEERGLIVPIGKWVIEEAARQAAAWQSSRGLNTRIAVNVSAVQFRQKDFIEHLVKTIDTAGIPPDCLELELTESIVMRNTEAAIEILEKLKKIGFQLSIDDFGTGYSSLSYLRRFPIDKIKIAQPFVADKSAVGIINAIIGLARNLKIKVIAEGVETEEQLAILKEHGCDEAQGFLLGHALPSHEFEAIACGWQSNRLQTSRSQDKLLRSFAHKV